MLETLLEAENERVVKTVVQDIVQYGLGLEKLLRGCERPEDRAAVLKLLPAIKSITKRGYATGQFNIEMMRSAVVGGKRAIAEGTGPSRYRSVSDSVRQEPAQGDERCA